MLSNLYLHYVLDLWFERVVKSRLRGEARLVRYIDDFVICFQYRSDALRVQDALRLRLGKFGLTLEPTKTKLVEFGRFAQRHAGKRGRNRPETIYFLGLTLYCTRNLKGNFKVGMRTEKSRLRRSLLSLQELMRQIRHHTISEQVGEINAVLRGHYAYYGVAGNIRSLVKVYRVVERYWRRMLCSRSWAGRRLTWERSTNSKNGHRYCDPSCASLIGSCRRSQCCEPTAEERGAGNPHATFCGNRRWVTASGDPVRFPSPGSGLYVAGSGGGKGTGIQHSLAGFRSVSRRFYRGALIVESRPAILQLKAIPGYCLTNACTAADALHYSRPGAASNGSSGGDRPRR